MELWKDIEGYENKYKISNYGRILSVRYNLIRKTFKEKAGYIRISFPDRKNFRIHRLVAIAFINNPFNYSDVNHIDGDKTNNHVSNLEWVSEARNNIHAFELGLKHNSVGEQSNFSKLSKKEVLEILNSEERSLTKLSKKYNVSRNAIWKIRTKKTWKYAL